MSLDETLELPKGCLHTMVRSIVEVFPREPFGDVIGKKLNGAYIIKNVYPIQTATRKPTQTSYGNNAARKRLIQLYKALNKFGGIDTSIIGQYHVHRSKNGEERYNRLSKDDIKFDLREIEEFGKSQFIEVILSVKRKPYKTEKETGMFLTQYKKKLRIILRCEPLYCYDIFLSAYKIPRDRKIREMKVEERKIKVTKIKEK